MLNTTHTSVRFGHRRIQYLSVSSLIRSRRFYRTTLGLELVDESAVGELRILERGETRVVLYRVRNPDAAYPNPQQLDTGITILSRDFLYTYQYLKNAKVQFAGRASERPNGSWEVRFHDPDGYILNLVENRVCPLEVIS